MKNVIEISKKSAEYYVIAERWKSDLQFFKTESAFLHKLKEDYYFTRLSDYKNMEELQKASDKLNKLQADICSAELKVDGHLRQLKEVAEGNSEKNYRILELTDTTIGQLMISLTQEYKEAKKQIFASIETICRALDFAGKEQTINHAKLNKKQMLRELNEFQIETLLKNQVTGRIGCHSAETMYIVPVNYIYDGANIYCHSAKGMKIDMMRENPQVCFEVDNIKEITNWQSVIAWGKFEEITELEEKQQVLQKLTDRVSPFILDDSVTREHGFVDDESDIGTTVELIIYKIIISKKTGRFEKR